VKIRYTIAAMVELHTPLTDIGGIQTKFVSKLKKLGIETVHDLLWHFPVRYEDFSQVHTIEDLTPNQEVTITATVEKIKSRNTWRRSLFLVEAELVDETGVIRATWFNQPYIKNVLQPGRKANFAGKVVASRTTGELYLSNPTYELVSEHEHHETKHTARIVPIYRETRGLTSKGFRYLIQPLLAHIPPIKELFSSEILEANHIPEINDAIKTIHFPNSIEEALEARRRFAFEDLFFLQLQNLTARMKLAAEKASPIPSNIARTKSLIETLPFELTTSQKQSLWEIVQDIEKPHPMNRLLQGDVGSGKTVIAGLAALSTAEEGLQVAFMAPTEILARQHYKTFLKLFPNFEKGVALLTAGESRISYGHMLESPLKKVDLIKNIKEKKIHIVMGTHALIQKSVTFPQCALVIVDEQHRFGVKQRATLEKDTTLLPHFLSMSATPIPRTLSLTLFGDLDLSLITELPKNRKLIITRIIPPEDRTNTHTLIRDEIKRGQQVFVICPRIEKPEEEISQNTAEWWKLEIKSVKEEYEKLSQKIFPDLSVGMLHGKMKASEKESIMQAFSENKINILVATSVIEVGIDIPNATIMMIEGAERFGLAQLYQFRGRVGRGDHQSYCFLFTDSSSSITRGRLRAVVDAKNGFELAEKDLKMRGPGEFFGEAQTGMPDLAMKAIQNPDLVKHARETAQSILSSDPSLTKHPHMKERFNTFRKEIHWE
jgi:ATP-dependent DNA helicase RecG